MYLDWNGLAFFLGFLVALCLLLWPGQGGS
jgi:hypothetical protein